MTTASTKTILQRRLQLLLIALVFFGPLGFAFYMYYGAVYLPHGRVNHGTLISPARPLDGTALLNEKGPATLVLLHKWSLLYVVDGACNTLCHQAFSEMQSQRLALGKDIDRVQRVALITQDCCARDFLEASESDVQAVWLLPSKSVLSRATFPNSPQPQINVIDPLGNLMMSYPVGGERKGLQTDLRRLLRLSHIG